MLNYNHDRQFTKEEKILSTMIHSFVLGWIKTFKYKDLKYWIDNGLGPDINYFFKRFQNIPMFQIIRRKVQNYYFQHKEKVMQYFNYREMLYQIDEHKNELKNINIAELALTSKGQKWFETLINNIRIVFLEDIKK
jgi:hypothetical protein